LQIFAGAFKAFRENLMTPPLGSGLRRNDEQEALRDSLKLTGMTGLPADSRTDMDIRSADEAEITPLAKLWYDGWQDAHARIVPAQLVRLRTLESFAQRLHAAMARIRVAGPMGEPAGLCIVKDDELYQLFVSAQERGSGIATALIADAEAILAAKGVETAWLTCVIGNERAARFYAKHGWQRVGVVTSQLETSEGLFPMDVWRYEKRLG
jgi:GNAT superfamily N-acetyltransferase